MIRIDCRGKNMTIAGMGTSLKKTILLLVTVFA
ncbi:MAG: hypothetical protein ACI9NY_002374, partial [Kiritimatiellia bacterium]